MVENSFERSVSSPTPLSSLTMSEKKITIIVKSSTGTKWDLEIDEEATIEEVKNALAEKCSIPAAEQRLIYSGRLLRNEQTLKSIGKVSIFVRFSLFSLCNL